MSNVVNLGRTSQEEKARLEAFSNAYADNGGDHVKAYIEAGFSEKTASQNAKKYLDRNHEFVMKVVKRRMGQLSANAQAILIKAMNDESIPWGHRLKAIEMVLKNSGVQKETLVIEENNADDLTPEERQAEIQELVRRMESNG